MTAIPILLGIAGGISAYKVPQLLRELIQEGYAPVCVLTRQALRFVTKDTLSVITQNKVWVEGEDLVDHIQVARYANLLLVVPATANMMAKFANGIADDLLSTIYLAFRGTVLIAPAMHTEMWEHEATQRNMDILIRRHGPLLGPVSGALSCGDFGMGRLIHPDMMLAKLKTAAVSLPLLRKKVIVVMGPCKEPIDPVRCLSNRSSGKMGLNLAILAKLNGAHVTLISSLPFPEDYGFDDYYAFSSHGDLKTLLLDKQWDYDHLFMAAAVSDFTPVFSDQKLSRKEDQTLELQKTSDILAQLGMRKSDSQNLIGFCLVAANLMDEVATQKRLNKACDYIVANTSDAVGAEFRNVSVYSAKGKEVSEDATVLETAQFILEQVLA